MFHKLVITPLFFVFCSIATLGVQAQVEEAENIIKPATAGGTVTLASGTNTTYRAQKSIILQPTFQVLSGATFIAMIGEPSTVTITFPDIPAKTYGDPTFTLNATASNGAAITYTSDKPELASVSGNTVTIKAPGTVTITARSESPIATATKVFTISKKSQVITIANIPDKNQGDAAFQLAPSSNSGLTSFTYTLVSGPATVSATGFVTPSSTLSGAVSIKIGQAGNDIFLSTETTVSFNVRSVAEQITFATIPSKTFGDPSFTLSATSNKGSAIVYTSSAPAIASINGNAVSILGAGTVTFTAKAQNSDASITQTITIAKKDQEVTIAPVSEKNQGGESFQLSPTSTSGLSSFTYSLVSGPATVSPNGSVTPSATAGGRVTIKITQPGNENYLAKEITTSFDVRAKNPTISFTTLAPKTFGDAPFDLSASSSGGSTITFTSDNPGVATISGSTVTITGAGVATIIANTSNPVASTTQTLTVKKAPQIITVAPFEQKRINDPAFQLQVTSSSPLKSLSFKKISGPGTVSAAGVVTPSTDTTGIVAIKISHPGDNNYLKEDTTFSFKIDGGVILSRISPATLKSSASGGISITLKPVDPNFLVNKVTFHYKKISDKNWNSEPVLSGARVYTPSLTNKLGEIGLSYYFSVNYNTNKFEFTDVANVYVEYENGLILPAMPGGSKIENYQIISSPLDLAAAKVEDVFKDLGAYDIKKWRLFHYDTKQAANKELTLSDTIKPGNGYWLITRNPITINTGAGTAVQVTETSPFRIQLKKGYNQIGNPYNFPISWEDVRQANNPADLKTTVSTFSSNGWKESTTIKAFEGAFVWAEYDFEIRIPTIKPDASLLKRASSAREDQQGWKLVLSLIDKEGYESKSAIGMMPNANESKDVFDAIALPRFMKYLEMNSTHPEYFAPKFSQDIVPEKANHIWNFNVETNASESNVAINWDINDSRSLSEEIYLLDKKSGVAVNMKEKGAYHLTNSSNRELTLFYGDKSFIESTVVSSETNMNEPYPNPFSEATTISYSLASSNEVYDVDISVYNMVMEKVISLEKSNKKSGFYHADWNGLDYSGEKVPAGLYFVRVKASAGDNHKEWLKKVILK
ncbi:MAG TPA: FlgD immunoglobulin-like domain containing protein [Cytophagaceae bacterium]|jgi:hypothetical protein